MSLWWVITGAKITRTLYFLSCKQESQKLLDSQHLWGNLLLEYLAVDMMELFIPLVFRLKAQYFLDDYIIASMGFRFTIVMALLGAYQGDVDSVSIFIINKASHPYFLIIMQKHFEIWKVYCYALNLRHDNAWIIMGIPIAPNQYLIFHSNHKISIELAIPPIVT